MGGSERRGCKEEGNWMTALILNGGPAKAVPFQRLVYESSSRVVCPKFAEEQPQILRLTTPNRKAFGAPFAQDDIHLFCCEL